MSDQRIREYGDHHVIYHLTLGEIRAIHRDGHMRGQHEPNRKYHPSMWNGAPLRKQLDIKTKDERDG